MNLITVQLHTKIEDVVNVMAEIGLSPHHAAAATVDCILSY